MTEPGRINYTLPSNASIDISCEARAGYLQRITLTLYDSTPVISYQFQGVGEPGDMKVLGSGDDSVTMNPFPGPRNITLLFEYDPTGTGNSFRPVVSVNAPIVKHSSWGDLIIIASEDGGDADYNDSTVFINTQNVKAAEAVEDDQQVAA